jgi:glucosamine--fructose-6-phosphate aminotransferase (isomerizing)
MSVTLFWYILFSVKLTPPASRASSRSWLERELREQGAVLARRAAHGADATAKAAALLARDDVHYLVVAARGSSDNAAVHAQYAFGAEAGMSVALAAPSLYRKRERAPALNGAAVLGISQSGQSPDIVAVLGAARAQQRPTIAITNDTASPLAGQADVVVPLATGDEHSVAATKTYMASLEALHQILNQLQPTPERTEWLARLPDLVTGAVEEQLEHSSAYVPLTHASLVTAVGRGMDLATARETALKIRELGALPTEAFSPPDLLHGPIAALASPGCIWLIAAATTSESWAPILEPARERSMPVVVVSPDAELRAAADHAVALPGEAPAWVRAILAVVPGQVAALRLAERRGLDIDHPHGLAKVTITS